MNILIYGEISDDKPKQLTALALLTQLQATSNGVLSTQVLKEYCNVAIKKLKLPVHFYDALVYPCTYTAGRASLHTEDLNAGENTNGVSVVNPSRAIKFKVLSHKF
jgi:predicted nucleic acid-binding protein